jgi:hypothetical protein
MRWLMAVSWPPQVPPNPQFILFKCKCMLTPCFLSLDASCLLSPLYTRLFPLSRKLLYPSLIPTCLHLVHLDSSFNVSWETSFSSLSPKIWIRSPTYGFEKYPLLPLCHCLPLVTTVAYWTLSLECKLQRAGCITFMVIVLRQAPVDFLPHGSTPQINELTIMIALL